MANYLLCINSKKYFALFSFSLNSARTENISLVGSVNEVCANARIVKWKRKSKPDYEWINPTSSESKFSRSRLVLVWNIEHCLEINILPVWQAVMHNAMKAFAVDFFFSKRIINQLGSEWIQRLRLCDFLPHRDQHMCIESYSYLLFVYIPMEFVSKLW